MQADALWLAERLKKLKQTLIVLPADSCERAWSDRKIVKIRAGFGVRRKSALFVCARNYAVKQCRRLLTNSQIVQARKPICDIIKEKSLKQSIMLKYKL